MFRNALLPLLLSVFAPSVFAVGVSGWTQLKLGMMPAETAATLGNPLIRSASRGFELWIYDGHAEVLFFSGPVVAWTPPSGPQITRTPQVDVIVPSRPTTVSPAQKNTVPTRNSDSNGYEQLPLYRFRRRQ